VKNGWRATWDFVRDEVFGEAARKTKHLIEKKLSDKMRVSRVWLH